MKKYHSFTFVLIAIFTLCLSLPFQVYASNDLKVTSNKSLTSKFNKYDTVTIGKDVTLTLTKRSGEPVGLEIVKSLTVEKGGKITGPGLLIFDRKATFSGITLYYKWNGDIRAIPSGMKLDCLGSEADDYKPTFEYDESQKIYILTDNIQGGDPFALSLNVNEADMVLKETMSLSLSGLTDEVFWSSSDKSVATVSKSGLVTAKKVGQVVITAKYEGSEYFVQISVHNKGFDNDNLYLNKGDEFYIGYYGAKIKKVTSSKKAIATAKLKDGQIIVKGIADGTCKITVTDTKGKKAVCNVTVGNPKSNENTNDNTNPNDTVIPNFLDLAIGSTSVIPVDNYKDATFSSSKKSVASVSKKGIITAKKEGSTTVTVKIQDKKYKIKVEVRKPGLNTTSLTLEVGDQFYLSLFGEEIKSVSSSNKAIATVTKKLEVTGKAEGTCKVKVKTVSGKEYYCDITVVK